MTTECSMTEKINKIAEDSVAQGGAVGSCCMVFKDGRELFSGAYGFADRENNIPMQLDSIFRLFSLTKPVTAAAAMILADRGLLSPDDPVSRFFPEYSHLRIMDGDKAVPCTEELKVIHLLTMTSGLPYANNYDISVSAAARLFDDVINGQHGGTPVTTEDFARKAAQIPLSFVPGERWDYGISADILGGIIEQISGMRYGEFLKKNIFDPLGMSDTGFYVPESKRERFTALYKWQNDGLVPDRDNYLGLTDYTSPPAFESGGAGLVSTISDYSRFAQLLSGRGEYGGIRLLSENAFRFMASPKLDEMQRRTMWSRLSGYNYGTLVRVMTDEEKSEIKTSNGEIGWDGWTGTYFCSNPETGITVLYFTQIAGAGTTWQAAQVSRIVYDELVRKEQQK